LGLERGEEVGLAEEDEEEEDEEGKGQKKRGMGRFSVKAPYRLVREAREKLGIKTTGGVGAAAGMETSGPGKDGDDLYTE